MPPTSNTTLKIPPVAVLGEIAYRQYCFQSPLSSGSWARWADLSDEDRRPWLFVGLVVADEIKKANQ
jgi:hypothetical protein